MALSNINNIDPTYPVAGIDQPSQGFRDNFADIKQSLLDLDSAVVSILDDLVDVDTASTAPTLDDVLRYNGTKWVPNSVASLGYITAVADDTTPVLGGDLDVITNSANIVDDNGSIILEFDGEASPINHLAVVGVNSGNDARLEARGGDSNINLALLPQGTGEVIIQGGGAQAVLTSEDGKDFVIYASEDQLMSLTGGSSTGAGNAGDVLVDGGASTSTGDGGNVLLRSGGSTGGSEGVITMQNSADETIAEFATVSSPVNYLEVNNSATTLPPTVWARGTDANVSIKLAPKGSGNFVIGTAANDFIFPNTDGTSGQALTTDGAGNLSFTTVAGGGGTMNDVIDDTTPQLGGNLDVDDNVILNAGTTDEVVVQGQLISYKDNATSLRMKGPDFFAADVQSYMGIFYNAAFANTSSSGLETRAIFGANIEMDMELQAPRQLRLSAVDNSQTDGQIRMASKTDVVIHTRTEAELDSVNNIVFDRDDQGTVGAGNTSVATIETDSGDMLLWPGRKDGDGAASIKTKGNVVHQPKTSFSVAGDAQSSLYILRNETTDATQTELFVDGTSERAVLADDTTWFFRVHVVARRTDADDESAAYIFEGAVDRNTGAATTAIVGSVAKTVMAEDNAAWDVDVDADATNGSLRVRVTGEAAKTVRWVAKVDTTEVTG